MRIASVFFILLSVIIALIKPSTIVSILGVSWGAIGMLTSLGLNPVVSLITRKMNLFKT
ncbi:MAG: hypothetical protein PF693_10395 [Spirochaetia bacterium]|jgi:hypothetical protein|nr:hypothetical protein [Spirochaetia bacterium]